MLSFETGGAVLPPGPLWQRASTLDPMDLKQLAENEGAHLLIELAEGGGATGKVALSALVLAPDARSERARACELLADVRREERSFVLQAVHYLLSEGTELHEETGPAADSTCRAQLQALAGENDLPAAEKDLAASALARLH